MSPGWGSEVVHGFCYSYFEAVVLCRAESAGDFGRLRAVAIAGRMHVWRIVVGIDTGACWGQVLIALWWFSEKKWAF